MELLSLIFREVKGIFFIYKAVKSNIHKKIAHLRFLKLD